MITELRVYTQTHTHAYTQAWPLLLEIHTERIRAKIMPGICFKIL